MARTILHIDINSCFASCEQQDHPEWRGRPLGVVQDSGKRSVIIASSREAKEWDIGTGDPIWEARRKYKDIILVPADFERYAEYSRQFRKICFDYSYRVEVFSLDELFMDITKTAHLFGGPVAVAKALKRRMRSEVGDWLSVSVGIAPNKMLAKLASGSEKPDGLVIVPPDRASRLNFLDTHPLWHICGIGYRIERRLKSLGAETVAQLRTISLEALEQEFGIMGVVYHRWAHGEDPSPVMPAGFTEPDKSYGNQMTLPADTASEDETMQVILWLCWQVAWRMRKRDVGGKTVSLFLRRSGKSGYAQQSTKVCNTAFDIYRMARHIYAQKLNWEGPIRFAGVSIGNLTPLSTTSLPLMEKEQKQLSAAQAWDQVARKYGPFVLRPAALTKRRLKQTTLNGWTKKF